MPSFCHSGKEQHSVGKAIKRIFPDALSPDFHPFLLFIFILFYFASISQFPLPLKPLLQSFLILYSVFPQTLCCVITIIAIFLFFFTCSARFNFVFFFRFHVTLEYVESITCVFNSILSSPQCNFLLFLFSVPYFIRDFDRRLYLRPKFLFFPFSVILNDTP